MKWSFGMVGLSLALCVPLACGSDDDDGGGSGGDNGSTIHASCPDLCSAAQAANCTFLSCDCNQYCNSLDAFKGKGGCDVTANAYEGCALRQQACEVDAECSSQGSAFESCILAFCASNPTDSDCLFLVGC